MGQFIAAWLEHEHGEILSSHILWEIKDWMRYDEKVFDMSDRTGSKANLLQTLKDLCVVSLEF